MTAQTLKRGWKMVKFGEVVKNANLVERDPERNGIERIVGLEHIDPDNLHIRRWNSIEEVTSFTRKLIPGQTLFGKRRAYQRKVAYAEFEGICSGDILTFESKDKKVLLPELLPFICQSDAFFEYALDTSAGSLSPRTSWKALKDFEFPLPPIDEQKRMAEILWAADDVVETYNGCLQKCGMTKNVLAAHFYSLNVENTTRIIQGKTYKVRFSILSDECELIKDGTHLPPKRTANGPLLLGVTNIIDGQLQLTGGDTRVPESFYQHMHKNWVLKPTDVLLAIVGATIGKVAQIPTSFPKFTLQRSVAVFRGKKNRLLNNYLKYYLETKIGQIQIWKRVNQTAQPGVYLKELSKIPIPMVSTEGQIAICKEMDSLSRFEMKLHKHLSLASKAIMTMVNNLITIKSGTSDV